ncbi:hypothetical protein CAG70_06535 [Photobacterium halotolerans]|uniref:S-type pyocin domain-containing protein n=1 Tax=Photobacterium halotolerans TaxID=265726 RepID=UPI001372B7A2|nr:hypothetical protein [Photobacterium halotolerans]
MKIDLNVLLDAIQQPAIERPSAENSQSKPPTVRTHTVQRDPATGERETWPDIAQQYGLSARELLDLNPLYKANPLSLEIGNVLTVQSPNAPHAPKAVHARPPEPPQAFNQALNSHYRYDDQCIDNTTIYPLREDYLVHDIPVVRIKSVVTPVFAKSCNLPQGSTDAGAAPEPITNFGPFSWFFSSAHAAVPVAPPVPPPTWGAGTGAGVGAAGQANKDAAAALTRLAGKLDSALDEYTLIASGGIASLFLIHQKIWHSDDTQHSEEELRNLETVQSRIRISLTDPAPGELYPTVHAWHMNFASIPVLQVKFDESNQSYSVALEKDGPHLTWLPAETGDPDWQLTPDQTDGFEQKDIHTTPVSDEWFPTVETYPADTETHWSDFVLVFPQDSGIPPIYIVYWENQPRGKDGRWGSSGEPKPTLHRTSLRAETKRQIEAKAKKDANGNFLDDQRNVIENWHYGHKPGSENRRILRAAEELGMTQEELNDFVNSRPDYFQIEDAVRNWSHADEKPGYDELEKITRDMKRFLKNRNTQ